MIFFVFAGFVGAWFLSELSIFFFKTDFGKGQIKRDTTIPLFLLFLFFSLAICPVAFFYGRSDAVIRLRSATSVRGVSLLLLSSGIIVRWIAIVSLKTGFNTVIGTKSEQQLVTTGLYSRIRHPSYLGSLMAFCGFFAYFEHPIAFAISATLAVSAYVYRIRVEERILSEHFGEEYDAYCRKTFRLIPFLY